MEAEARVVEVRSFSWMSCLGEGWRIREKKVGVVWGRGWEVRVGAGRSIRFRQNQGDHPRKLIKIQVS